MKGEEIDEIGRGYKDTRGMAVGEGFAMRIRGRTIKKGDSESKGCTPAAVQ